MLHYYPFINVITFVSVFYKLFSQSYKKHNALKFAIVTGCYLDKFCHLSPLSGALHCMNVFIIDMLYLFKSKTDFLKIPEICDF